MSCEAESENNTIDSHENLRKIIDDIRKEKERMTEHLTEKEKVIIEIYENSLCFVNERMSLWKWYKSKRTGIKYFSTITYINKDEIEIMFNSVIPTEDKTTRFYPRVRAYTSGEYLTESLHILNEIFPKIEELIKNKTEAVLIELSKYSELQVSQIVFENNLKVNVIYAYDKGSFIEIGKNENDVIRYKYLDNCDGGILGYSGRHYCVPIPSQFASERFYDFIDQATVF